jgi:hypothetical protein
MTPVEIREAAVQAVVLLAEIRSLVECQLRPSGGQSVEQLARSIAQLSDEATKRFVGLLDDAN